MKRFEKYRDYRLWLFNKVKFLVIVWFVIGLFFSDEGVSYGGEGGRIIFFIVQVYDNFLIFIEFGLGFSKVRGGGVLYFFIQSFVFRGIILVK